MEECKTCRFWMAQDIDTTIGPEEEGLNVGICRRYPPSPGPFVLEMIHQGRGREVEDLDAYQYPRTSKDDWCGEYQPRKVVAGG